ncbi:hypothetical protein Pelo_6818 [Pelomyxa schiedti]|nr:hypothetical protein Pelo_6818 [Pelomyxa schiedti]
MAAATTASTSCEQPPAVAGSRKWFSAAYRGEIEALRAMLARDPGLLNSVNDQQQRVTALHAAAWGGNPQCVEFLLSVNVNVSSQIVCDIPS